MMISKLSQRNVIKNKFSTKHLSFRARNIEDDGYGRNNQGSLWNFVASKFQDHPNPGTLILVRHGEYSFLNACTGLFVTFVVC